MIRMLEKRWYSKIYWSNRGASTRMREQPIVTGATKIDVAGYVSEIVGL